MRRGQAALEFLTTYGWAFLVILVMIGAISYFGVMNPNKVLPGKCTVTADFSCKDYQLASAIANVQLSQGIGKSIYFQSAFCSLEDFHVPATASVGGAEITAGAAWSPRDVVELGCDFSVSRGSAALIDALAGEKVKVAFNVSYTLSSGGFLHVAEGELFTEVQ